MSRSDLHPWVLRRMQDKGQEERVLRVHVEEMMHTA